MSLVPLFAALSAAPSVASIQDRLVHMRLPDTCDYRMETRVQAPGVNSISSAHVVQAGPTRSRMDMEAGGRRLRFVRSGDRMATIDLATGRSSSVPVSDPVTAVADLQGLRSVPWKAPVAAGAGLWRLEESGTASPRRMLTWSETAGEIVELDLLRLEGDTLRTLLSWTTVEGRKVPASLVTRLRMPSGEMVHRVDFSAWGFPRSVPASLFALPAEAAR